MAMQPTNPTLKTTWDPTKEYALKDIVFYEGIQYVSVFDGSNQGHVPGRPENIFWWSNVYSATTEPPKPLKEPQKPKPEPKKKPEEQKPEEQLPPGITKSTAIPPQKIERPAPELTIQRTPYPKWWNEEGIAKIQLSSPGSQLVITARGDFQLFIGAIVLTVSGECDITFTFGGAGASGSMNFGGSDEPRGLVIAMGNSPAPCGSGSFMITATSTDAVTIGGYVAYYMWKKQATK